MIILALFSLFHHRVIELGCASSLFLSTTWVRPVRWKRWKRARNLFDEPGESDFEEFEMDHDGPQSLVRVSLYKADRKMFRDSVALLGQLETQKVVLVLVRSG